MLPLLPASVNRKGFRRPPRLRHPWGGATPEGPRRFPTPGQPRRARLSRRRFAGRPPPSAPPLPRPRRWCRRPHHNSPRPVGGQPRQQRAVGDEGQHGDHVAQAADLQGQAAAIAVGEPSAQEAGRHGREAPRGEEELIWGLVMWKVSFDGVHPLIHFVPLRCLCYCQARQTKGGG